MEIINNTPWASRSLRKLLVATVNRFDKLEGKSKEWRKTAEITFLNTRGNHYTGTCSQKGSKIVVRIPRIDAKPDVIAALLEHQYSHNRGYTHKQMPRNFMKGIEAFAWAQAAKYKLELAPVKEAATGGKRGRKAASPAHKAEVQTRRITRKIDRLLAQIMALEKSKGKLARKTAKAQVSGKSKRGLGRPPRSAAAKPKKNPSGRGPGRPRKIKTETK